MSLLCSATRILHHDLKRKANHLLRCTVVTDTSAGVTAVPVFERALKFWNDIALIDSYGEHSYGQLYNSSNRLATLVQNVLNKDARQQRICLLCSNNASYVTSQWATWMTGHVAVPLNPKHPAKQLEYFITDSGSKLVLTTGDHASKVQPVLSGQEVLILEESLFKNENSGDHSSFQNVTDTEAVRRALQSKPDHLDCNAIILYTSGTTGPPKGVVLTHRILASQIRSLLSPWGWTARDSILHCLPLNHTHGIVNALMCPLYIGARVIMEPEFKVSSVWSHLLNLQSPATHHINVFMGTPTMYAKLLQEYNEKLVKNNRMKEYVKAVCSETIRLMVSGSAPLPVPIFEQWKSVTGHTLLERYGMTEIGMALSNPLKGLRIPGSVGRPLPEVEVCIAKFSPKEDTYETTCYGNSEEIIVKPGMGSEVGELLVKGPSVFKEYWNKPSETVKAFTKDGWFRTGDTAQLVSGNFRILGRTSVDIIKSGGFKISALDVERHLLSHPNIADVAVVGVPDFTWGQKVAALIEWTGDTPMDPGEIRSWAKNELPHYQVPSVIKAVEGTLPRNAMGKINKKEILKDFFSQAPKS